MLAIDEGTEFGARVARRLREEIVVWLTTVTPKGAPLPSPVWFIWDGEETVRLYSLPGARARNLAAHPRVTLNFDGNGHGGDIVVLAGSAVTDPDAPGADGDPEYAAKYAAGFARLGMSAVEFAAKYSVPIRITLETVRGH